MVNWEGDKNSAVEQVPGSISTSGWGGGDMPEILETLNSSELDQSIV